MALKWRIVLLAIIVLACVANHVEHALRARQIAQQAEQQDIPVMQLDVYAAGHSSLSIEESGPHKAGVLTFSTLEAWAFSKSATPPCPPTVRAVDGQRVKLVGFMFPLQESAAMKSFCLLRSTQTCCYGPQPQFNQYVLVEADHPVKFERLAPVVVDGLFRVDPKPAEGYIYRMEEASVRSATGNDQPPSPQEVARKANLPLFDFTVLEHVQQLDNPQDRQREIVRQLLPLDGKPIVVPGFVIRRPAGATSRPGEVAYDLKVGLYPELKMLRLPDPMLASGGKLGSPGSLGSPALGDDPLTPKPSPRATPPPMRPVPGLPNARLPDPYNTVLVSLRSEKEMPPLWWQEAVFKGTLRVNRSPADWPTRGVVALDDATLATPAVDRGYAVDTGLRVPWMYELLFLAVGVGALLPTLIGRLNRGESPNGGRA